ncbi:MAG: hypothetical protein R3B57_00630 [Phycisphaerales bacterium]
MREARPTMDDTPSRRPRRALKITVILALAALAGGCSKSPLAADGVRSQFDRYDRTRYEDVPAFTENEFGERTPNLRGRLLRVD